MLKRCFGQNKDLFILLGAAFLAIFAKFWEPGIGISSTGYGSLAKNILETGNWFSLRLGKGLFDPFVDHPLFIIWMNAALFKIFGVSAQSVRLLSSFMALGVFASLYTVARRRLDEQTAALACIALLTVNVFMNFTSSGWLDLPMIGLVWIGFGLLDKGLFEKRNTVKLIGAFILGLAVIGKGVSAVAVVPILLWVPFEERKITRTLLIYATYLVPIVLFTLAHYQSEHFLFWKAYLFREGVAQNNLTNQVQSAGHFFWYIKDILRFGHIVSLLGIAGIIFLYKKRMRGLALLISGEVLIHILLYGISSRHYAQYVIPVFPWLSFSAAVALRKILPQWQTRSMTTFTLRTLILVFVILDLLPIRVHSGNETAFRPMTETLSRMNVNKNVYFYGDPQDQDTWEDMVGYISWYWNREPIINNSVEDIYKILSQDDPKAMGLIRTATFDKIGEAKLKEFKDLKRCLYNDLISVITQNSLCPDSVVSNRPRELPKESFVR